MWALRVASTSGRKSSARFSFSDKRRTPERLGIYQCSFVRAVSTERCVSRRSSRRARGRIIGGTLVARIATHGVVAEHPLQVSVASLAPIRRARCASHARSDAWSDKTTGSVFQCRSASDPDLRLEYAVSLLASRHMLARRLSLILTRRISRNQRPLIACGLARASDPVTQSHERVSPSSSCALTF